MYLEKDDYSRLAQPENNLQSVDVTQSKNLGLIYPYGAGVQIDLNTVPQLVVKTKQIIDGHKCDHNCLRADGAGYDCPASITRNRGLKSDFPPLDVFYKGLLITSEGARRANHSLIESGCFADYAQKFQIPDSVSEYYLTVLMGRKVQINFFGGNPEMYQPLFMLADELKESDPDLLLNLTTTGRRSLVKSDWTASLVDSSIDGISLSCDEIDIQLLKATENMSDEELKFAWQKILKDSPLAGSRQKALEAIYTARQLQNLSKNDRQLPIIFNLVIHHGNLGQIEKLTNELHLQFPLSKVNPFPAQSSMEATEPTFEKNDLFELEKVIDWAIQTHINSANHSPLVPRLHYYLMLKAAFNTYRFDSEQCRLALSGYGVWNCYDRIGAARYVQVGASNRSWFEGKVHAGGHLGCYWNDTVTDHSLQVWNEESETVARYITSDVNVISKRSPNPCAGCIMPRLTFDLFSQEVGMNPKIVPAYLDLRRQFVGF